MPPFLPHALAMAAGFLCMCAAAGIAMFLRRKRWWLKAHRSLGIFAPIAVLLGLTAAVIISDDFLDVIMHTSHGGLGVVVIVAAITTPILGLLQFKVKNRVRMRMAHRYFGRSSVVLAAVTVILGLRMAGLFG